MASLIPGYEYDIFISYRHNDNRSGWVTEFVEALQEELAATIKELVSVYFDTNPHDGLLETHNVDKSLEGKLKCLIFIPIISQTYCDSKSFAWQYEFLAFNKLAKEDSIGRDIKLRNGNYASRILPIRIHDLEQEDVKLFEKETGTVLRSMDFIFKTASGVNRPLKANEDHPQDNLNKTFYGDQINKIAHAIKEIILGMKKDSELVVKENDQLEESTRETKEEIRKIARERPVSAGKWKLPLTILIIAFLLVAVILVFPKIFSKDKLKNLKDSDGRISIAVTIFDNNTNDTTLNWLSKGIPELIRNNLTGSEELSVQNSQTMYELYENIQQTQSASIVPSLSREAAIKLKTGTYITGSFQKFGNSIVTYIKLIDTKSDELLWTGSIEGNLDKYKNLADSLSVQLKDFLEIKVIKQKASQEYSDVNTNSPEALRKYVEGMQLMINGNFKSAAKSFEESFYQDTTFTLAALYASMVFSYDNDFSSCTKWTKIAYKGKMRLSYYYQLWIESGKQCNITKNSDSVLYYNDLLAQSDLKSRLFWFDIGYNYIILDHIPKAIKAFEKAETISSEWEGDWKYVDYYVYFGHAYHIAGLHDKERRVFETGLKLSPDNMEIMYDQAICAIAKGDSINSTGLINQLIKMGNEQKWPASEIETGYGNLYAEAKSLDKAEEHYRAALRLDSNNSAIINTLAFFLISNERHVDEADSLSKKILKINPQSYKALWAQGLVCYKYGRYKDALNILQQAYAKLPAWNGPLYRDIKKVKKAITSQK